MNHVSISDNPVLKPPAAWSAPDGMSRHDEIWRDQIIQDENGSNEWKRPRSIDAHRAFIRQKMRTCTLVELVQIVIAYARYP